jgi:tRNA(fMet)-specific endonuclease VapC
MRWLLDANAVIALLRNRVSRLARRVRQQHPADVAISAIVVHELFYGAFKSSRATQNVALVDALQFPVIEFDREDARQAGQIRAFLSASGLGIGPYDVLIAGQAVARDIVLVTHNTQEFAQVPRLRIEDWEA